MAKATTAVATKPPAFQMPALSGKAAAYFSTNANVLPPETVPSLSPGGKKWTIGLNGTSTILTKLNSEGEREPLTIMKVVILDYQKRRGRTYYEGAYDPDKPGMPTCWSEDGVKPADNVAKKQCATCAACPNAVKGSRTTDNGKAATACSQNRMIALVPANKLDYEPLRMKIAITSDWDGNSPDHEAAGWYGFQNYLRMLNTMMDNKDVHTARLVTKMKFDPNVDFTKVLFAADRPTTEEEADKLIDIIHEKSDKIARLISGAFTPNGADGVPVESEAATSAPGKAAAKPAAKVAAEEDENAELPGEEAAPAPAAAKPAAPIETEKQRKIREAKEALAAAEQEEAEEEEAAAAEEETELPEAPPAKPAAAAAGKTKPKPAAAPAAAKPASTAAPGDLTGLLGDWDA